MHRKPPRNNPVSVLIVDPFATVMMPFPLFPRPFREKGRKDE
jgi:hypothetical protein